MPGFRALIVLLMTMVIAGGASRLALDNHYSIFFDDNNSDLVAHQWISDQFTRDDNILVVVTPRQGTVFTEETLLAIRDFSSHAWTFPHIERVDSIANFQSVDSDDKGIVIAPMLDESTATVDAEQLQRRILREPELLNQLISPNGKTTAINLAVNLPRDAQATRAAIAWTRQSTERFFPADSYDVRLHGIVALNNAFMEATDRDAMTLMPVMLGIMFALIALSLRSFWQSMAVMLVIVLGSISTLGFVGWCGFNINMVNVVSVTIMLALAVADCVHLGSSFTALTQSGIDKKQAISESLSLNFKALFLTSLTTALGFLGLLASDSPPIRELGLVTALGVIWVFVLTITIFPVLLVYVPAPKQVQVVGSGAAIVWARRVQKCRWLIIVGALIIGGVCVIGAQRNVINDHASHYFKDRAEFKQATLAIEKTLTGLDVLTFALSAQRDDGVNDPAYLAMLDEFTGWLRQQPEVVHVRSYTDVLKRINRAIHGDDSAWHRLPDSEEMAAQYLLVYSMSTSNGLGISDRVSFDHRSSRVTATLKISNPAELLALDQRATQWMHDHAPNISVRSASVPKLFAHIGINNIKSMMQGNVLGVVLIALVLGIAFRSVKYGAISLLPNAFPALVALGLWGFGSGTVNLAVTIVFSITVGIIVDDTIHFLSRYLQGRKQGMPALEAVANSYRHVGMAMLYTTVVLASGFGVLAFSDFNVNAQMGLMVSLTLVIAVLFDLVFLPALLLVVDRAPLTTPSTTQQPIIHGHADKQEATC